MRSSVEALPRQVLFEYAIAYSTLANKRIGTRVLHGRAGRKTAEANGGSTAPQLVPAKRSLARAEQGGKSNEVLANIVDIRVLLPLPQ